LDFFSAAAQIKLTKKLPLAMVKGKSFVLVGCFFIDFCVDYSECVWHMAVPFMMVS
jgi:hypothetical protein